MADPGQWYRPAGRTLVVLTSVLTLLMPLTESLCNWDRFLRGGSDVEFNLLAGLLFAALVILAKERSMAQPLVAMMLTRWVGEAWLLLMARCGRPQLAAAPVGTLATRHTRARNHERAISSMGLVMPLRI